MSYNNIMDKVTIAGLKINSLTKSQLLADLSARLKTGQKTWVTTPYSEFLHAALFDPEVLTMLNSSDIAKPMVLDFSGLKNF